MSGTLKHLQKLQSLLSQKLTHLNMDGWKTIVSGYIWLQLLGLGPYPPITRWRTVDGPPQRWGLTGDGWSVLGVGTTKIGRFFFLGHLFISDLYDFWWTELHGNYICSFFFGMSWDWDSQLRCYSPWTQWVESNFFKNSQPICPDMSR